MRNCLSPDTGFLCLSHQNSSMVRRAMGPIDMFLTWNVVTIVSFSHLMHRPDVLDVRGPADRVDPDGLGLFLGGGLLSERGGNTPANTTRTNVSARRAR